MYCKIIDYDDQCLNIVENFSPNSIPSKYFLFFYCSINQSFMLELAILLNQALGFIEQFR